MEKAHNAQQAVLNRAAARAIGEHDDNLGPQVMARAESRIGQEFKRLQDIARPELDKGFLDSLVEIDSANAAKGAFARKKVENLINKGLNLAEQGQLSGKAYKEIHTELSKQAGPMRRVMQPQAKPSKHCATRWMMRREKAYQGQTQQHGAKHASTGERSKRLPRAIRQRVATLARHE